MADEAPINHHLNHIERIGLLAIGVLVLFDCIHHGEDLIRLNTECTVAIAISFEIEQISAYPSTERETKKQANKQEQASRSEAKLGLRGVFSTLRNPSWRTESLLFASRSQSAADLHTCMVERFLNVQPRSNSDSQKHHSFIHSTAPQRER